MTRYKILKTIMLSFITYNDQYDSLYVSGPNSVTLELNEAKDTISVTYKDKRKETITQAHVIGVWLKEGKIEEIV